MRIPRRSLVPSLALALVAVAGSILPASAAVVVSKTGQTGSYSYTDTMGSPGATCVYNVPGGQGNDIDRITVDHPVVFSAAGTRKVGWRFIVQRSKNPGGTGGWVTLYRSSFQKRNATTAAPAAFTNRSYTVATDTDYHFRTLVVIQWYKAGSSTKVVGATKLRTEYYTSINGASRVDAGRCLPEY